MNAMPMISRPAEPATVHPQPVSVAYLGSRKESGKKRGKLRLSLQWQCYRARGLLPVLLAQTSYSRKKAYFIA